MADDIILKGAKMHDVNCPYCGKAQDIDHDDGYGYEEDRTYEQACIGCNKVFAFTTGVIYVYSVIKADCLNGAEHKYRPLTTFPTRYTKMVCKDCGHQRNPTAEEMANIHDLAARALGQPSLAHGCADDGK